MYGFKRVERSEELATRWYSIGEGELVFFFNLIAFFAFAAFWKTQGGGLKNSKKQRKQRKQRFY
jgi:hypothetical protein